MEPLFEMETGSSSSPESVLAGGVVICGDLTGRLGPSTRDPLRFFLDLGRIESEEGLGGVTNPRPLSLADPFINEQSSRCWMIERRNSTQVRMPSSIAINVGIESVHVPEQEREKERESLTEMINDREKEVEGKWTSVQEEWSVEKGRLRHARGERESKVKTTR